MYLFVAAMFILGGCTTKIHYNLPELAPEYPKLEVPIPLRVALIVPEKTREFAFKLKFLPVNTPKSRNSSMIVACYVV